MNGRSWKFVLVASLVLNVFLLGAIVGGAYQWFAARGANAPLLAQQRTALRFAAQTLPAERQEAFIDGLKNARREGRQFAREGREGRREVLRLLAAPQLDRAALDAMVPALSRAADSPAAPVKRLGFVFMPMGCDGTRWTPPGGDRLDELSPILTPLAPVRQRESDLHGRAVGLAEDGERQSVRIEDRVALHLPAVRRDRLREVARAVEQPDAHQRDTEVACTLQVIAREDAVPARVLRKRRCDTELGREVRDRLRSRALESLVPARFAQVGTEVVAQPVRPPLRRAAGWCSSPARPRPGALLIFERPQ